MAMFDKLICNLSELYYHSNPETKDVFAPAYAPDMLYHLFWTFLFIDQELRNPRAQPKVTCNYFVRLLQNEGGGYPREFFDKKALKNIYNDIRSRPLLPAPHLIRALQVVEGASGNEDENTSSRARDTRRGQSSFMNLANSIKLEKPFKRVKRWWKNAREGGEGNHLDSSGFPSSDDSQLNGADTTESTSHGPETSSTPSNSLQVPSGPPAFRQGRSSPGRSFRSRFSARSELVLNKQLAVNKSNLDGGASHLRGPVMNQGFTMVAHGWHPEGDGLDNVVCFPKATRPSTLEAQHQILKCPELMLEMET
ncbi:hypothetical protein BGZ80_009088 [Entomortierella chlamydospora]|uniref:SEC7 domain-containing protein n=1 Tax=Entomortierella chlamydospora TaxID=101097 RepID=A0A9P6T0Z1_9FUNG|nr:hypothetical protein BGZ79_007730 [Entomortierella chlamydospora]KAG0016594.1 hypothetical protein BGZ80_009088 [Entomortierella chlamydospora]